MTETIGTTINSKRKDSDNPCWDILAAKKMMAGIPTSFFAFYLLFDRYCIRALRFIITKIFYRVFI